MSERNIPEEQPPEEGPALREWLSRMMILINGALNNSGGFPSTGEMPKYVYDGLSLYFNTAIPPQILYSGPWTYIEGHWRPLVGMVHQGDFIQGREYMAQDVVYGDGWTMASKIHHNFDHPFPVPVGEQVRFPDPTPAWIEQVHPGVVRSGFTIEFTQGGYYGGLSIWITELTADTNYVIYAIDITDPDNVKIVSIPEPILYTGDWAPVSITENIVRAGSKYIIYIDALNSGSEATWQYPWTYTGQDQGNGPTAGGWNQDNQSIILRINKEDGDGVDHDLELQVIINTHFIMTQLDDPNKSIDYLVTGLYVDQGTYYEYDVVVAEVGTNGPPDVGAGTQVRAIQPIPQDTKYVQSAGYWPTNQPAFANVTGYLALDGVEQNVPDDAFGVRVLFTPATVSENWEYVAYTDR